MGHDRMSLLLRQRINPTRHIFHDISLLKYPGKEQTRASESENCIAGALRVEFIRSENLTPSIKTGFLSFSFSNGIC